MQSRVYVTIGCLSVRLFVRPSAPSINSSNGVQLVAAERGRLQQILIDS